MFKRSCPPCAKRGNERRRRSAHQFEGQSLHQSVKSGDMRGGFDSLHPAPPGGSRSIGAGCKLAEILISAKREALFRVV
jgi:hypothetical protein